ncbi:MAG: DUF4338 domain-containing protein [Phycisphaerae bacterium]
MDVLRYRGRVVTAADVAFIRDLIARHPAATRRALSRKLCAVWNWVQPNGVLRDMVCRGLLLALQRAGHIELPPARWINPLGPQRRRPSRTRLRWSPIAGRLADILPLDIVQVRRSGQEALFDSLVETYHYLGYTQPVGEHLKYLVSARGVPMACLAWSSAPRHIGCRDRFIGWSPETRRKNIRFIAYNLRYLILPWVQVPHLASHLLGRMARRLAQDWTRTYGHPVYFLETFVDPQRFRGTCYRAANWMCLGRTTGRGKDDQTGKPNRPIKEVWGYPLGRDFRERLFRME